MTVVFLALAIAIAGLSIIASYAKRGSSKAIVLGLLLLLLVLSWFYIVLALGVLSGHETPETVAQWPTPFLLGFVVLCYFTIVATIAFLRRPN